MSLQYIKDGKQVSLMRYIPKEHNKGEWMLQIRKSFRERSEALFGKGVLVQVKHYMDCKNDRFTIMFPLKQPSCAKEVVSSLIDVVIKEVTVRYEESILSGLNSSLDSNYGIYMKELTDKEEKAKEFFKKIKERINEKNSKGSKARQAC